MLESKFQADLKRDIKHMFPECLILKQEAIQGIPDLLILYEGKWAAIENKKSVNAVTQPNQDYYQNKMDKMSFCRRARPENKDEVLHDLEQFFKGGSK